MAVMAQCTSCGQRFAAPPQFLGKRVKCKACGEIFVVRDPDAEPAMDDLSRVAAPAAGGDDNDAPTFEAQPQAQRSAYGQPGRIGPKNEKRIEARADVTPFEFKEPEFRSDLRPNVMIFNFPNAWQLDQWLPLGVTLLSLGIYALFAGNQQVPIRWVALTRFALPIALYCLVIWPFVLRFLRRAGDQLRFQMPPEVQFRSFAAFTPAFAFAAGLWLVSDDIITALLGIIVGLGVSGVALWALFRLKETELPTTIGLGCGGFGIGGAISVVALVILNFATATIVTSAKAQASMPLSPFGPQLAWVSAPPAPPPAPPKPTQPAQAVATSAPAPPPPPATSAIATFEVNKIPGVIDDVVAPFSQTSVIGVVRRLDNKAVSVEPWDTQSWQQAPGSLELPARPNDRFVISTTGKRLAYISQFPHLSVQVWSFQDSAVIATIDLDKSLGEPHLLGFTSGNNLLVERIASGAVSSASPASEATGAVAPKAAPAPLVAVQVADGNNGSSGSRIFDTNNTTPLPPSSPSPGPGGQPPSATPPTTPPAAAAPAAEDTGNDLVGPTIQLINVQTKSSILKFSVPPLAVRLDSEAGRSAYTISTASQRFAVTLRDTAHPKVFQYDLKTGRELPRIDVADVDVSNSVAPTGMAYSNDGRQLGLLFENGGSGILLIYDASTGKKVGSEFVYPYGPLEGTPHDAFVGTALIWLDPLPYLLAYGRGVLHVENGAHVKADDIAVPHVVSQRLMEGARVLLVTGKRGQYGVTVANLDQEKLTPQTAPPPPP